MIQSSSSSVLLGQLLALFLSVSKGSSELEEDRDKGEHTERGLWWQDRFRNPDVGDSFISTLPLGEEHCGNSRLSKSGRTLASRKGNCGGSSKQSATAFSSSFILTKDTKKSNITLTLYCSDQKTKVKFAWEFQTGLRFGLGNFEAGSTCVRKSKLS